MGCIKQTPCLVRICEHGHSVLSLKQSSENAQRMAATLHLLFILKQYIMLSFWPSDIFGHLSCAGITCPCQEKCDLSKVR